MTPQKPERTKCPYCEHSPVNIQMEVQNYSMIAWCKDCSKLLAVQLLQMPQAQVATVSPVIIRKN